MFGPLRRNKGIILIGLAAILLVGLIAAAGLGYWIYTIDQTWSPLIEPRIRERQQTGSIRVMALNRNGESKWIGSLTSGRLEERSSLHLADVPPLQVQSIVVLEDPRFLEHGGFDPWGIMRAILVNIKSLRYRQGGSTPNSTTRQECVLTSERSIKRKLTELVLAGLVENRFTKDEILEAYMNEVYLGQVGSIEIHGVGRAANYYFNKQIADLEVHEMALLAAMIAGPGVYSPWKAPEKTMARRNRVLKSLLEAQLILPEEYEVAIKKPLPKTTTFAAVTRAAYLMDSLRDHLIKTRDEADILKGGFDITLNLDLELQELAEKTLLDRTAKAADPSVQGLVIAVDPRDCTIKTYVGGSNYRVTQLDRIRQSHRPVGSLMKPLEVAPLLENDKTVSLATSLDDQPLEWNFDKHRGKWKPLNFDGKFRGKVTVRQALEESLNVPIARLFFERFPSGDLREALDPVKALGFNIPDNKALPSALLGSIDQSPTAVALAYAKLVRQALGLADTAADLGCELRFEKPDVPATTPNTAAATTPTMPEQADDTEGGYQHLGSRLTIAALEGALRRGTSRSLGAQLPPNQQWAGKTGTSSDSRDTWYAALSPNLVIVSWYGRDDNKETGLTGSSGALPLVAPLVVNWSKRDEQTKGWSWPVPEALQWKAVRVDGNCLPNDIVQPLIVSTLTDAPKRLHHLRLLITTAQNIISNYSTVTNTRRRAHKKTGDSPKRVTGW